MLTQRRLPEDPRWNALHRGVRLYDDDDSLLGMNMPPEGGRHRAKVKRRPPAATGQTATMSTTSSAIPSLTAGASDAGSTGGEWNGEHRRSALYRRAPL
ncbi:hypothetical protein KCP74_15755 [Salmonella enterica subsp. enterica]|nr:hypothetical protein KCP74_15755 [Salmonella enterica subsp. enterica]